jgi:cytosolic phospholipase A2
MLRRVSRPAYPKLFLEIQQLHNTIRSRPRQQQSRSLFGKSKSDEKQMSKMSLSRGALFGVASAVIAGSLTYILYQNDYVQPLPPTRLRSEIRAERQKHQAIQDKKSEIAVQNAERLKALPLHQDLQTPADNSAWGNFSTDFALFSSVADLEWGSVAGKIKDFVMPDWAKVLPDYIGKLQRELSMAPGSLADEIWQEAHDPYTNPEIEYTASVRVSSELCKEERPQRQHWRNTLVFRRRRSIQMMCRVLLWSDLEAV